ncbi:SH3 domain-containing protein [Laspinema sp. D1]|uniref:SH3 domain-containing protein n=1 Tax=Laspinema palackyanum TaxID=3231601 RepID=UPI00348DD3F5|nr:SH3 domain-containing protein [Laspinema sp. D2b]
MKPLKNRTILGVGLGLWAIASTGFNIPATTAQSPFQLAQATGTLCRQVTEQQGLAIRSQPNSNSPAIGGVDFNGTLTLAEGARQIPGPDGRVWFEIIAPVRGYVSNGEPGSSGNFVPCTGTATPLPNQTPAPNLGTTSLCRRVDPNLAPQGISVHADASRFATNRGGLAPGAQVLLAPNAQLLPDQNREPRTWIEISSPIVGYIPTESLIYCNGGVSVNPLNPTPVTANLCREVEGREAPDGLVIRAEPTSTAAYLGVVPPRARVTLIPNYQILRDRNSEAREWVQITTPVSGFVSTDSLIMCR